jgi:hypothetical protein
MAAVPTHLDYARPAADRSRARYALLAVIALAVLALLKFLPPAFNHLVLLHHQSRCLAHAAAPDAIVFDSATNLEAGPARDFERFYARFSPPGGRHDTTLFLGELRRPDDNAQRLVNVEVTVQGTPCPQVYATVFEPGDLWNRPRLCSTDPWPTPFRLAFNDAAATLQLHAARRDPKDPSHFTIPFTYASDPGTIDGWLRRDDTLLFELRAPLSAVRR